MAVRNMSLCADLRVWTCELAVDADADAENFVQNSESKPKE